MHLAPAEASALLLALFVPVATVGDFAVSGMLSRFGAPAPVFIPMFMLAGSSPKATAADRIGDSEVNVVTPLDSCLLVILGVLQRHRPGAGIGSLAALMVPCSAALGIAWTAPLVVRVALGLDGGPAAPIGWLPARQSFRRGPGPRARLVARAFSSALVTFPSLAPPRWSAACRGTSAGPPPHQEPPMKKLAAFAATALALAARADEGMWTYDAFPGDLVQQRYGFKPDARWLETARLASVRLAQGCSASLVSATGLVMTNHHCAHECVAQLSTPGKDYVKDGFLATEATGELRCPELEVNQLEAITDVTVQIQKATAGKEGTAFADALKAEKARLEKACQAGDALRCEVVTLFHGGRYDLYRYRRFQDVRLAFAPELAIAFFGGDPDNFTFPRYDLDVAFLRVYQDGKPAHLRWSPGGARDGELTFVAGNPGSTSRELTVARLAYQRDVRLPANLMDALEVRGQLSEYQRRGAEQARHSQDLRFFLENGIKANKGRLAALRDDAFFQGKVAEEAALRAALVRDPELARTALPALDAVARAQQILRRMRTRLRYQEWGAGFEGTLFEHARTLVRGGAERQKPNEARLEEYGDAALPALTQRLFAGAPVYRELERFRLGNALSRMREDLGVDDAFVKKVLGQEAPEGAAARLVDGTRLADPGERRRLWDGGTAAVAEAARTDPMLALAIAVDADGRAVRKLYEDEVEAVERKGEEALAEARRKVHGTSGYPDATFSPRLSFGKVAGLVEDGKPVPPFTTLGGAYGRATGREPFALPPRWLEAKAKLDLATPFNLVTTNDIIGGNSGSPVFNQRLEVVGLIFDGNIWSLGGDYGYDPALNRAVAVDSRAILTALDRVYDARRLVKELEGSGAGPTAGR
jgi:hypothetical protein